MSAWDWNYAVLRGRWPKIAEAINAASIDGCAAVMDTPAQALVYQNRQITSAFDPMDEAKWQADGLDREAEAVYCYGIGLGHLPAVLAARHKHVCVVLMNLSIARAAMESSEQRWLAAPHVALALAESVPILYIPYACVPMDCRLADSQGHATRDRLFAHVNARFVKEVYFGGNEKQDRQHVDGNKCHTEADNHVRELFGTLHGHKIVIAGGGPSLKDEIKWLKEQKEIYNRTIICASTVLRLFLDNEITPDIVVVVDTGRDQIRHMEGVDADLTKNITLVYHPTVMPEFVGAWQGRRYYYNNPSELYTSGTVMHTVADLAVKMGAVEIVMLGCDFCYPANKSHVDGASHFKQIEARPSLIETLDGYGNKVHTDLNLAQYHRHLEDYIARADGVRWWKRGRAGVPVRGAKWM